MSNLKKIAETAKAYCLGQDAFDGGGYALYEELETAVRDYAQLPKIVCLCGSTRFWRTFQEASLNETLAGKIVLSIGAASGTDDDHFGNLPREEYDQVKAMLDDLHLRKIDLADEVLILNVDGYIGESTKRELEYAIKQGKPVRYWSSNLHTVEADYRFRDQRVESNS